MNLTQAGPIETPAASPIVRPDRLRAGQAIRVVVLGLVYWLVGVLMIRYAGQAGWFGGGASLAMFAGAVVIGWPTVWSVKGFASLAPAQVVTGVTVATAAAIVCDGAALTWWPGLYGSHASHLPAAGWLLWAAGVGLLVGWYDGHRA